MQLIPPLSVSGRTPDHVAALPEPTEALCGAQGVNIAVGYPSSFIVYRGVWTIDRASGIGRGSWSFSYFGPV